MAVHFKDFDRTRDWRVLVEELSLTAAGAILSFNPVGLYKGARDAVTKSAPTPGTDERAGIWLRVTATSALLDLLNEPAHGGPIRDAPARKDAAKAFVNDHLTLDGTVPFGPAALENLGGSPALASVRADLPTLVPTADAEALRLAYDARLRRMTARVFALDPDLYGPLEAALQGAFAQGWERDKAWERHGNWVRSLFHSDPIFSPDRPEDRPLSAVYHRLRCFWHTEEGSDSPDRARFGDPDDRAPKKRTAHVADLHETLHAWLDSDPHKDTIRLVAGGPGSGKSSASRAFAAEVLDAGSHRLIYVRLQHMDLIGDLYDGIGKYLTRRHDAQDPAGSEGFPDNPLDWMGNDTAPLLLVFDGLDELSHHEDTARTLALRFIANVTSLLTTLNTKCSDARALVLGRDAAVTAGREEARLGPDTLLHVAPLTPIDQHLLGRADAIVGTQTMLEDDQRPAFWRRVTEAQEGDPVSEAVTAGELGALNAEPLLLHLLIVSGYTGDTWRAAAENRNLVYEAIFRKIYARDQDKPNPPNQSADDFFTLMECLGLAAWRGAGRTGSAEDFAAIRDLHCTAKQQRAFEHDPHADLGGVAVQFYTRRDIGGEGFEFIHKSFGEYLVGRALLRAGLRAARLLSNQDDPRDPAEVAAKWAQLVNIAEITEEVLGFLVGEARLLEIDRAGSVLLESDDDPGPLTHLFNWVLASGLPVQEVAPGASYRELETRQRCAETALVAVIHALNRRRLDGFDAPEPGAAALPVRWPQSGAARFALERLRVTSGHVIHRAVSFLDCHRVNLSGANLGRANFVGANLGGAVLSGANLVGAELGSADLRGAELGGATLGLADLRGADLRGANLHVVELRGANLGGANLGGAKLDAADLARAQLVGAKLVGANLDVAKLVSADLQGADLHGANLGGADMRDCSLTQVSCRFANLAECSRLSAEAVKSAFGVSSGIGRTLLPDGVPCPEHWHEAAEAEEDSEEAYQAYQAAYQAWRGPLGDED